MSIIDSLRDKLSGARGANDDAQYDDYDQDYDSVYDQDAYYDDAPAQPVRSRDRGQRGDQVPSSGNLLGNSTRPAADSIAVYTRSGRPLDEVESASGDMPPMRDAYQPQGYVPSFVPTRASDELRDGAPAPSAYVPAAAAPVVGSPSATSQPVQRVSSGQLPPYVLKPTSYDDVQTVVRRVRTNQPVVLSFLTTNIETAKRILDFSLGLSCGVGGEVTELGDRVFVVLPAGVSLSQADIEKLVRDGVLKRG